MALPGPEVPSMLTAISHRTELPMVVTFAHVRPFEWLRAHQREFGLAFVLILGGTLINASSAFSAMRDRSTAEILSFAGLVSLENLLPTLVLVFALTWAERLRVSGWRRHLVTVTVATGTVLAVDAPVYFLGSPYLPAGLVYGITASPLALLLYGLWLSCVLALIARSYIAKSNEERAANARLAQSRGEQVAARRRLVVARLAAIQARIDPRFLFDMLDAVQRAYEVDVRRAELLLDELIVFLRAALPRLRTTSSTIGQECDLAKSYVRLRTLARLSRAELDSVIPGPLESTPFPPGVLLPLVEGVLRSDSSEHLLLLTADATASHALVVLASSASPGRDTVTSVSATLAELFGSDADLVFSSSPDRAVLTTVRVPYEPAGA